MYRVKSIFRVSRLSNSAIYFSIARSYSMDGLSSFWLHKVLQHLISTTVSFHPLILYRIYDLLTTELY